MQLRLTIFPPGEDARLGPFDGEHLAAVPSNALQRGQSRACVPQQQVVDIILPRASDRAGPPGQAALTAASAPATRWCEFEGLQPTELKGAPPAPSESATTAAASALKSYIRSTPSISAAATRAASPGLRGPKALRQWQRQP